MQRKEKRRKLHEALLNMLYPSPPPNQLPPETRNVKIESEEDTSSSSSSDEQGESGSQKLTRAQRKRLRKKKFNEASSLRRKFIGPLLPSTSCDALQTEPQVVRHNAAQQPRTRTHKPGDPASCSTQNKVKQRRMAKKLAREKSNSSTTGDNDRLNI